MDHLLAVGAEFDGRSQAVVGTLAAGLDDQLRRLEHAVEALSVEALEWQSAPGTNAIGMLLAHLALVEVWWIRMAPAGEGSFRDMDARFREVLGIGADDDGMPADGRGFPAALRGRTAKDYVALLRTARASVHEVLRGWTDADLARTVTGKRGTVSYRWILYHVLEHFAGHFGQVLLIRHQLRDAGLATA
jgi:uncharacterized damage-inducible protein DinB